MNKRDQVAKALFDQEPHNHPRGKIPDWNNQPEHLKNIFRARVK